jgi:TRAP transporter TAXI family solute receptor
LQPSTPSSSTSGGYSKPLGAVGAAGAIGATGAFSGGSKFDKQTVGELRKKSSQESLQRYQEEKSRFKNPEYNLDKSKYDSNPLYQKGKVYSGFDYGNHYSNRDNYYRAQGYRAPGFAFGGAPSFGIFDTLFLFWMLDHLGNKNVAATAYHHQNDPGYQKWRQEADQLAKDNAELKGKLAELDKQVKSMEGTPKDPSYLPAGVPPEVALSAAALATKTPEKPTLRVATGQTGGWYEKYASLFRSKSSGLDIKIIPTSGAFENLKLLADGKADLAIVQSDVLAMAEKKLPDKKLITEQSTLYPEYVQLIANTKSGIKSINDIDPSRNIIYVGPKGSGSALTWEGLCEQNEKYSKMTVQHSDFYGSLEAVQKNPNSLMLFVGGLNSDFLKKAEEIANKSGNLALVAVDDSHFDDKLDQHGNPIYSFANIQKNIYPSLQKGWIFGHDTKTLAVQAVLALRTEWAQEFGPNAMDSLSLAILDTQSDFENMANGTKQKK